MRRFYGLSSRHKPPIRTIGRFPQHVERTEYRRHGTLKLSSSPNLEILACISTQGPPRPSSTLPASLLPSLLRRCSETTIHLQTMNIALVDPFKFWESAKPAGEDVRVKG
ncbi:hypothetical protein DPMN_143109 [Dreissena polymorpha]|uniref:Uncharacterized protein n=1 Tax=Dreissena polymorpha TaxID=45954 RepID=A0A9D4GFL1_DREPO|nr:hypothetical protein DPMN_143109 [Dreissena polymorpha]